MVLSFISYQGFEFVLVSDQGRAELVVKDDGAVGTDHWATGLGMIELATCLDLMLHLYTDGAPRHTRHLHRIVGQSQVGLFIVRGANKCLVWVLRFRIQNALFFVLSFYPLHDLTQKLN